jgi:NADP-dependent 3-hydroxy acid dehydrogenase YdfG
MSTQRILITGATSGFGEAIAKTFARTSVESSTDQVVLILTGRRQQRLDQLKQECESFSTSTRRVQVITLCFDIQSEKQVTQAFQSLAPEHQAIDLLVNNAGLAKGMSTLDEGVIAEWDQMIDTNVKGLLYISRQVIPEMIKNKKGHIINIGSTAAKSVYSKGNVYCATKHAVDALSQSMRIELLPHGIKVTAIHPGAAETEFSQVRFNQDHAKAKAVYAGLEPLVAQDIADIVYYCYQLPAHVCINDLLVTCTQQADALHLFRKNET